MSNAIINNYNKKAQNVINKPKKKTMINGNIKMN